VFSSNIGIPIFEGRKGSLKNSVKVTEKRPGLVRLVKALEPDASNRAIAAALGVNQSTVSRDLSDAFASPDDGRAPETPGRDDAHASRAEPDEGEDDMDDVAMLRVYATENATQRGNTGAAQAGTVASAIRLLAKAELTGNLGKILPTSPRGEEIMVGNLTHEDGIGWRAVLALLPNVRGLTEGAVRAQLANLKASGDYGRIIAEVKDEIERENKEALAELAEAGAVASAIRILAKAILTDNEALLKKYSEEVNIWRILQISPRRGGGRSQVAGVLPWRQRRWRGNARQLMLVGVGDRLAR
jgi:hypothetical protein